MNKKIIAPIAAAATTLLLSIGSTFALFTNGDEANIAITSGKVNVTATLGDLKLYSASLEDSDATGVVIPESHDLGEFSADYYYVEQAEKFANGGTATLSETGGVLTLDKVSPGDKVTVNLAMKNESNINVKYRVRVTSGGADGEDLFQYLKFNINGYDYSGIEEIAMPWEDWAYSEVEGENEKTLGPISVIVPLTLGNEWQNKGTTMKFALEAIQGNAHVENEDEYDATINKVNKALERKALDYPSQALDLLGNEDKAELLALENLVWNDQYNLFGVNNEGVVDYGTSKYPIAFDNHVWEFVDEYADNGHPVYLLGVTIGGMIEITNGFDAGQNNFVKITYTNTGAAKNVAIKANGGDLVVNAPNDTVRHFGAAKIVTITSVSSSSYYEYGAVTFIDIANGRLVFTNGEDAEVGKVFLTATEDEYDDIILATMDEAELPEIIQRQTVTNPTGEGNKKLVATIQQVDENGVEDEAKTEHIYLYGESTAYEETKKYTDVSNLGEKVLEANAQSAEISGDEKAAEFIEQSQNKECENAEESIKEMTANKDYGFSNSYEEDGHWVHEITNAEEFRNIMDSTTHKSKTGQFDYPGAGDPDTVYLIKKNINFGGAIYSAEQIEEVKAKNFTGILRGNEGVVLSNVHLTEVMKSGIKGDDAIWGLFDGVLNAKFESLTLSDFTIDNSGGKVCGLLAAGQSDRNAPGSTGFDDEAYLEVSDVTIGNGCYVNVSANAGAFFGILRNLDKITVTNCINNADVRVEKANIGGFSGDASFNSLKSGNQDFATNSISVNDFVNNGKITCGEQYGSAFIGYNLHSGTITNFTNNGVIECLKTTSVEMGVVTGRSQVRNDTIGADAYYVFNYENVIQNGYLKYVSAKPKHNIENKYESNQIYYTNNEGQLVSAFDGVNAPTSDYLEKKVMKGDVLPLSLSYDANGLLKVADCGLTNIAKISVSLYIGRHTALSNGVCHNSNSTPAFLVHHEDIVSTGTMEVLNNRGFRKVNQLGYFSPEGVNPTFDVGEWGRIAQHCEKFHLDTDLYGTTGYTEADLGYGINSKGGYVLIRDINSSGFSVLTPLHQDPNFIITAYDANGNVVASGNIYSGRIVGEHIPSDIHVTDGIDKYVYLG